MMHGGGDTVIMQNIVGTIIRKSVAQAEQAPDISAPLATESLKTKTFPHQPRNDQLVKTIWPIELKERDFKVLLRICAHNGCAMAQADASPCAGPDSNPGQSMRDLWRESVTGTRFSPSISMFLLFVLSHPYSH
jgi:hypothetical protein